MEYGRILKRALETTWRHKVLWVFGIAAALFGAGRGGFRGNGGQGIQYMFGRNDVQHFRRSPFPFPFAPGPFRGIPFTNWDAAMPVILAVIGVLVVVGLLFLIVRIIVSYTSLGALAGMVNELEETEHTSLGSGFKAGWRRFPRLFAIDLLIGVVMFVVALLFLAVVALGVLVAVGPAWLLSRGGGAMVVLGIIWGVGLGLGLLVLIIAVSVALGGLTTLVREFAIRACVLDKKGVFDSLGLAITLTRSRIREAGLMWLLLVAINVALSFVTVPLALLGIGTLVGPALFTFGISHSVAAAIVVALPFLLILIAVAAFIGGVYLTFGSAVWTLTYRELRGKQTLETAQAVPLT